MSNNLKLAAEKLINQFANREIKLGYTLAGIHDYTNDKGNLLYIRIRLKHPDGNKWIRPFRFNSKKNSYELGEPEFPKGKPLYHLSKLLAQDDEVWLVEGESKVELLEKLGLIATTSGGCTSASTTNFEALSKREIIIWPDNDAAGLRYAHEATKKLLALGCNIQWVDTHALNLPEHGDCIDWAKDRTIEELRAEILTLPKISPPSMIQNASLNEEEQVSSSTKTANKGELLLSLIEEIELFHDEQKTTYATIKNADHYETWPIESLEFKTWLSTIFWKEYKQIASELVLKDAISVMRGQALYEGKCYKVFTRVGLFDNKIYIHLANDKWQVVEVSSEGWSILETSPIKFQGLQNMRPLPIPIKDRGDINLLWQHINIPESSRILVLAWLLECFIIETPFPILILEGLQGSGKSYTQEQLRKLIDPSTVNLRGAPKNVNDILVAAANNFLISYNNVSHLTSQSQDDLCCLCTGGGIAQRRLFTTTEEEVTDIKRPVIINGIGDLVTRQDLMERCIIVNLPNIDQSERKTEIELQTIFNKDYPLIFGGLLNTLVLTLKAIPTIKLPKKPRMASFAVLGTALERVLGYPPGAFLEAYAMNNHENMVSALGNSSVAEALIELIREEKYFNGTYQQLLNKLASNKNCSPLRSITAKKLASEIKRQIPALSIIGINVRPLKKRQRLGYLVEVSLSENSSLEA